MKNIKYKRVLISFLLITLIAFICFVITLGDDETGFEPGLFANKIVPVIKHVFGAIALPGSFLNNFSFFHNWWGFSFSILIGCVLYSILIELMMMGVKALEKKNPLSF